MAFTGVPVLVQVSDSVIRITGISLAGSAAGTISLFGGAGDIQLPKGFKPSNYVSRSGQTVTEADSIEIIANAAGAISPSPVAGGDFAEFFALMPGDNAAPIAPNADVQFPQDGPTSAGGITRLGPDSFQLAAVGTYEISYQVSTDEPGQLAVTVGGLPVDSTRAGRATGTNEITNTAVITTVAPNAVVTVRNSVSAGALTITPIAGGTQPVSATLVIRQLAPAAGSADPSGATPIITKVGNPPGTPFLATITNPSTSAGPSLELYVRFH